MILLTLTVAADRYYSRKLSKKEFKDYRKIARKYKKLRTSIYITNAVFAVLGLAYTFYLYLTSDKPDVMTGYFYLPFTIVITLVFIAVFLHNSLGLTTGYMLGKLFKCPKDICKTLAIEIGMQNSGLGVNLAMTFFTNLSALPGAIFSLWHNISGILLAKFWTRKKEIELDELVQL